MGLPIIYSIDKFSTVAKTTVLIRAGQNNFAAMGVTKVSADEGIRDLEPSNEIVYSMTKWNWMFIKISLGQTFF